MAYLFEEAKIAYVKGLQVLDSRGDPAVEVTIVTEGGGIGKAIAPAGASKGKYEAVEIRDTNLKAYKGRGVYTAIRNVNTVISNALIGLNAVNYRYVDRKLIELDGTPNKSKLGVNAVTATSLANIKAASDTLGLPLFVFLGGFTARTLPVPMMNIINGGLHAGNELSIQEFMIMPINADKFSEALRMAVEVYKELKNYLKNKYGALAVNVGDEGGFAPPMKETAEALDALVESIKLAGYEPGKDILIALDCAATQFYDSKSGKYRIDCKELGKDELIKFYKELCERYPIFSVEDPLHEEDFEGFKELRSLLKGKPKIIGDDLTVTNIERVKKAIDVGAIDGVIIKVNQVGTVSEVEDVIKLVRGEGLIAIVSHRSGESEDVSIAHLAVGFSTGFIKTGAPARGERTVKYNELLRIEDWLGEESTYFGKKL